jgi:WD40 repeat protein
VRASVFIVDVQQKMTASSRAHSRPRKARAPVTLSGHAGTVYSVVFSPEDIPWPPAAPTRRHDSGTSPTRTNPPPLATLTGHTNNVNSVAFGPDGHTLATTSSL